jgi:hypothetical protein
VTTSRRMPHAVWIALLLAAWPGRVFTHSGPPFPLVSDRIAGPYQLSLWTDPDATDNGSAAGQFWLMVQLSDGAPLPSDTRALIEIRAQDRAGDTRSAQTSPVDGNVSRQFAALLMDHEGPFAVQATISGARGTAGVNATVDATYDLRPARWLLGLYVLPFVAVGFLWLKLLLRRRRAHRIF